MISCTSSFLIGFFAWGTKRRERERERAFWRRPVALHSIAQSIFWSAYQNQYATEFSQLDSYRIQTKQLLMETVVCSTGMPCPEITVQCTQTCRFQALSTAVERRTSTCEVEKQRWRKLAVAREWAARIIASLSIKETCIPYTVNLWYKSRIYIDLYTCMLS